MARPTKSQLSAGTVVKPANLSERASQEWDRLVGELTASGVAVSSGHRPLLSQAATIAADIADAWEVVKDEGAYTVNEKTGTPMMHPAAKRLDSLRRDYIKVLGQIGLRGGAEGEGPRSLSDIVDED